MKANTVTIRSAVWAVGLGLVMALAGCQEYHIDSQPVGEPRIESDALEQYNVSATDPETILFNIGANTPWKITVSTNEEDKSWCVPSPGISSASGLVAEVSVAIAENEKDVPREALLTISGEAVKETIVIKVVQESRAALQVSGEAVTDVYGVEGGMKTMTVRTNRAWEIVYVNEADREWLHFDRYSGEADATGSTQVKVTADANTGLNRTGAVIIKTAYDEVQKNVIQKGATLEVEKEELATLAALPASPATAIEVAVSATVDWTAQTKESWIKGLVRKGDKFSFVCDPNESFASRKGVITLQGGGGKLSFEVPVTQSGASILTWALTNEDKVALPAERITEKGILFRGNDAFRLVFPGVYKNGTYTWEFEEISIAHPLVIIGSKEYDNNGRFVPNTHIVLGGSGNVVGPNDWRVNNGGGNGWWITWQNVETLRKNHAQIKTVKLVIDEGVGLYLYDKAGKLLNRKHVNVPTAEAQWAGSEGFGFFLTFPGGKGATETDYCILKSFKAEPKI